MSSSGEMEAPRNKQAKKEGVEEGVEEDKVEEVKAEGKEKQHGGITLAANFNKEQSEKETTNADPEVNVKKAKKKKKKEKKTIDESSGSFLEAALHHKFNEAGELIDIATGEKFVFHVCNNHYENQERYENLGEAITQYVYELLVTPDVGLKKLEIPLDAKDDEGKGFIFVSENYEQKEKLMVLVHGSGVVRAGQWARRLIINDNLERGTQIPYIKKAIKDGYGVVVLNTNQNEQRVTRNGRLQTVSIKGSESPERHFSYVWRNVVQKSVSKNIFVVAHSYGGYLVVHYCNDFPKILNQIRAVAFTDSVHSLNSQTSGKVRQWFEENSVNWVTSDSDLDTPMMYQCNINSKHITRVSAGTTKHEETSWKAMSSIFTYFEFTFSEHGRDKQTGNKGSQSEKIPGKDCGENESATRETEDSVNDEHSSEPRVSTNNKGMTIDVPDSTGVGQDQSKMTGDSEENTDITPESDGATLVDQKDVCPVENSGTTVLPCKQEPDNDEPVSVPTTTADDSMNIDHGDVVNDPTMTPCAQVEKSGEDTTLVPDTTTDDSMNTNHGDVVNDPTMTPCAQVEKSGEDTTLVPDTTTDDSMDINHGDVVNDSTITPSAQVEQSGEDTTLVPDTTTDDSKSNDHGEVLHPNTMVPCGKDEPDQDDGAVAMDTVTEPESDVTTISSNVQENT